MKNKILILLMSCDQPLYEQEEQACRDTFLKDAEGAGLSYYFYKGTFAEVTIDQENHMMTFPCPDGLGGTSRKTVLALSEALRMDDWDYVIKTNVSTWLDIPKIVKAADRWEGREDRNIYGAKFLANDASKNVPFPRGNFVILSRFLVQGIVEWAPKLMSVEGMPKTDDTLLCLSMLYYLQKVSGDNYEKRLLEVPSVTSWTDAIQDANEWTDALSIRCKDEGTPENTPENMRKVAKLKGLKNQGRKYRRPMGPIETKYGTMYYNTYKQVSAMVDRLKQVKEKQEQAQQVPPPPENKIEQIRKKLAGK